MDDSFLITPRVALSEIFESLAGEKTSPVRPARRSTGWSFDELGGDGLCLGDVFASESGSTGASRPLSADTLEKNLGTLQWDDLQTMHPNKIFAIAVEYIVRRAPQIATLRRCKTGKGQPWRYELAKLARDPMRGLQYSLSARARGDAYYTMTAWVSRLAGRSIRVVRSEMAEDWINKGKWKLTDDTVKCRLHFFKQLEKEPVFQDAFPELFDRRVNGRSTQSSFAVVGASAEQPLPVTQCYGYLATYNTNLGLQDSDIMQ